MLYLGHQITVTMPSNRYRGPPMTLANMRAQGVRSLWSSARLGVLIVDGLAMPCRCLSSAHGWFA